MIPGYRDFEFDLPDALRSRLVAALDELPAAPLETASLAAMPDAQGVYQLFLDDQLVYIGKTDAEAGLRSRLGRHRRKIQHRAALDPARITFKAVRVYVFTAIDLETQLIAHYGGLATVTWNGSGFGSNDPGRERDTTRYRADHFDALYPVDIDRRLGDSLLQSGTAAMILTSLKNALPYVFRFETASPNSRRPHPDLVSTAVMLPDDLVFTARSVIASVTQQLPPGWRATRLPSHVILYKESRVYPQGTIIAESGEAGK